MIPFLKFMLGNPMTSRLNPKNRSNGLNKTIRLRIRNTKILRDSRVPLISSIWYGAK